MSVKNPFKRISVFFRKLFKGLSLPCKGFVYGTSNASSQGALAQSHEDDKLQLVHVPTEYHPYNTYVYSIELNRILGYLDRELAKTLLSVFGEGFCLDGKISEIWGDGKETPFGFSVTVYQTMSFMTPYLDDIPYLTE